jgi:hypothetical protein
MQNYRTYTFFATPTVIEKKNELICRFSIILTAFHSQHRIRIRLANLTTISGRYQLF